MSLVAEVLARYAKRAQGVTDTTDTGPSVSSVSTPRGHSCVPVGLSDDELQTEAGADWDWLRHDVQALRAFAESVQITRTRERGEIPAHYTATTTCRGCGLVPIFSGVPETVDLCPWCWNRVKGLPMPRAPK